MIKWPLTCVNGQGPQSSQADVNTTSTDVGEDRPVMSAHESPVNGREMASTAEVVRPLKGWPFPDLPVKTMWDQGGES